MTTYRLLKPATVDGELQQPGFEFSDHAQGKTYVRNGHAEIVGTDSPIQPVDKPTKGEGTVIIGPQQGDEL